MIDITRRIGVVDYAPNAAFRLPIPANAMLKYLRLRFTGTVTVSGGTTDGTLFPEQPLSLLRELAVEIAGRRRKIISAPTLYVLNQLTYGTAGERTALSTAGVQSNTTITFSLQYDFVPQLIEPSAGNMCLLDTRRYANVINLVGLWGSPSHLISGGDRTVAISGSMIVDAHDVIMPSRDMPEQLLFDESTIVTPWTGANTALETILTRGGEYIGLLLKATSGTLPVPSDTVVNNVSVRQNITEIGNVFLRDRLAWRAIQAGNKYVLGIENVPTGYAFVNFTENYAVTSLVSTEDLTDFRLITDVNSGTNTNLEVVQLQILSI